MRGVITNELEICDRAINNNEISDKPLETLRILTKKYYRDGMNKEQIISQLHNFMIKNYAGYKQSKWQNILETLVKSVSKYESFELLNIESVSITQDEWKTILKLDNILLEKITFILLIYQKINIIKNPKSNGWINNCISDIFREAKIGYTGDEQKKILYKLYENKYILMKNVCDGNSIKINYINTDSENYICIDDFQNVISYYLKYKNKEKRKYCECCGKLLKSNGNKAKYCSKCAKEKELEKYKKYNKKRK